MSNSHRHREAFRHRFRNCFFVLLLVCGSAFAIAQEGAPTASVAVFNANNALPFSRFGGLFVGPIHPGIEFGASRNWSTKQKHDWFQTIKVAYFYHRFVQHGIPLYTELGYRFKFTSRFNAEATLGAGYMHSIAATSVFTLADDGQYKRSNKGGRAQANATFGIGVGYFLDSRKSAKLFTAWQQRLQLPFIKSYVPVLPYNNFLLGISVPIKK
jgi:hypothetical protein